MHSQHKQGGGFAGSRGLFGGELLSGWTGRWIFVDTEDGYSNDLPS